MEECFVKGFIFSIKEKTDLIRTGRFSLTTQDIKYYIKRYGIHILFISMLIVGLACGTVYAMSADKEMLASLDFLFFTNLDARLSQNVINTFCACFASDFIFLFSVFLLGLTPWGIPVLPFKGLRYGNYCRIFVFGSFVKRYSFLSFCTVARNIFILSGTYFIFFRRFYRIGKYVLADYSG